MSATRGDTITTNPNIEVSVDAGESLGCFLFSGLYPDAIYFAAGESMPKEMAELISQILRLSTVIIVKVSGCGDGRTTIKVVGSESHLSTAMGLIRNSKFGASLKEVRLASTVSA